MRVNFIKVPAAMRPSPRPRLAITFALALLSGLPTAGVAQAAKAPHKGASARAPQTPPPGPAPAAAAEVQSPPPAPAPAPTPAPSRLEHDVPPRGAPQKEDDEVPVDWVVRDGRALHRPQMLSLDVGLWPDTVSLGAFWAAPVLPRGFIRHVNDSFDLEFGLMLGAMRSDWYWNRADASTSWQLWPAFGVRWNFFLTHAWSTFITFKVAGRIGLSGPSPGWFDVFAGAGATYRIKERMHLRLELNYPQGAVVGLSFPIGAL